MGLLKLLAFPLSGPLWVARVVNDQAQRQMYDIGEIHRQMAELQNQHQAQLIDDSTYQTEQEALFERLLEAREYHRERQ